ncbi:MAG: hypothetical protein EHM58_05110 [Ignavibacteriae bacterium]|nr:MAG: hypothetical protein EHM58_05110 [Ignavibacteriota bacterium]
MRIINKYLILSLILGLSSLVYSGPRYGGDIVPTPVSTNVVIQQVSLEPNNVRAYFYNTGIFNQDLRVSNTPGFEWPKNTGQFACFTAGLSIGAFVDGQLREAMCSYKGEYAPGYVENTSGVPIAVTNSKFRIYKVASTDNINNNPDVAGWADMIPFGAPWTDINLDGIYDPSVDKPGIKDAAYTIFGCLTDGFPEEHKVGEGFGGGTSPLFVELHLTAWAYTSPGLEDLQFVNWVVINKNTRPWEKTYMGVTVDPDLGGADDDYIGCDTNLNMGFVYNGDNNDEGSHSYGANPPAFGMDYFTSPIKFTGDPNDSVVFFDPPGSNNRIVKYQWKELGLSSFVYFTNTSTPGPTCEKDPNGEMEPAYFMLKGLKKDETPWVLPPGGSASLITKFCYPGDPEGQTGWNEGSGSPSGSVQNCGGPNVLTGTVVGVNPLGDRRFIFNSGGDDFTVNMNDTQHIVLAQFVARGSSNLNSVTRLKGVDAVAQKIFDANFSVIPPPPPPKVTVSIDQDNARGTAAVTLSWTDTSEYYNFQDTLFHTKDDSAYFIFEGYEVYEVRKSIKVFPDFNKPETITDDIKLIAIFDLVDSIGNVVDTFSTGPGPNGQEQFAPFPVVPPYTIPNPPGFPNCNYLANPKVCGTGLNRHITLTKTLFDAEYAGNTDITFGNTYKYIVLAYGYNTKPIRGQAIIRNSLSASVITVVPEAPLAGTKFYYGNGDTLFTNRHDLGVMPIVVAQENVINAKYRIHFNSFLTQNTIASYDLLKSVNGGDFVTIRSNLATTPNSFTVDDSSRVLDGILFKVVGIRPILGNVGVVKDPGTKAVDSIQTRQYGWEYKGGPRNLEGSHYLQGGASRPWQSISMSLSYPSSGTYTNIGSAYKPDSLKNVKIVFTGYGSGQGQMAYRYESNPPANNVYGYKEMKEVPFKVYEIDPYDGTSEPRQLNCAFLEFPDATPAPDGKWEPTTDELGGKEVVYIFGSDYSATENPFYTAKNLLVTSTIDVMYVWSAKLINSGPAFSNNDELYIYPYTATRPGAFYEIDTKQPDIGVSTIASENNDLNNIKVVPNPYYGYNSLESTTSGRFITFRRLPKACSFKIYSLNGDLIKTLEKTDENSSTLQWNMTNVENVPVASGIYIVLIDAPGIGQKILKVAIFTPEERIDF